jgi:hypothetical protein
MHKKLPLTHIAAIALPILLFAPFLIAADTTVVFRQAFDDPAAAASVTPPARLIEGYHGTQSLQIQLPTAGSSSQGYSITAQSIAGKLITITAAVKAQDVSAPPKSWNGIKVMLILEANGQKQYPQIPLPAGTFDWRTFTHTMRIPSQIDKATLILGLEAVSGTVFFDDISIRTGRPTTGGRRLETRFTGHDLPRLRGVMYGPQFKEQDIRDLALDFRANLIRWQLNWTPMKAAEDWAANLDDYDKWLDSALAECDKALTACERYNISVLVDLHTPPGGRTDGGVCRMFSDKRYQDKLISVWDTIARRYKGRPVVYAYDLLNEAVEGVVAPGLMNWRDLATQAAIAVRTVDPGKPVVFEPSPWGGPDGFDSLIPLDIDRVIYSFHMYKPHKFTHQDVYGDAPDLNYPGIIDGIMYDKETLRQEMAPAIDFQNDFNAHIYVGEFSAIRWAPDNSAYRYLSDVIDLFEEYGWDWSYHAFREWDGWSVEHGPDKTNHQPAAQPTDRQKLLKKWFALNKKSNIGIH